MAFIFSTTIALTASAVWNDPTATAPGANAPTPINNSAASQVKTGGLSVGSIIVSGGTTLGDTTVECNATTTGAIRFNNGLMQVCSDTPQVSPSGVVTSRDPLSPPSCMEGEITLYDPTDGWYCGFVPDTLPSCVTGEIMRYASSTDLWECGDFEGGKFQDGNDPVNAAYNSGNVGINVASPAAGIHVAVGNDLTLSSTNHAATFGSHSATNIGIDNNEIMARNNGFRTSLYLQNDGGQISLRNNGVATAKTHFTDDGRVIIGGNFSSDTTGKLLINNTTSTGPGGWYSSIKFTNGSHNAIWNPAGGLYFGLHSNGLFYWGDEAGGNHEKYVMNLNSNTGALQMTNGSFTNSANLSLDQGYVYMGTGNQLFLMDGGSAVYSDSNGSISGARFYDKQGTRYGYIYGSGASFGLLDGDGNWSIRNYTDSYTMFYVNNSAKMVIESSGAVGIGTTNPNDAYFLDVHAGNTGYMTRFRNTNTAAGADLIRIRLNVPTPGYLSGGGIGNWMRFDSGGVARGFVRGYGNSLQYVVSSDRRLKKDIKEIDSLEAEKMVLNSNPRFFDWKETGTSDIGYIAQELKKVIPSAVSGDEGQEEIVHNADGDLVKNKVYMNVSHDILIPILHRTLKKNINDIDSLGSRIGKLNLENIEKKLSSQQEKIDLLLTKLKN